MKIIKFDERFKDDILSGRKRATSRLEQKCNDEDIVLLMIGKKFIPAKIQFVMNGKIDFLSDCVIRDLGFDSKENYIKYMESIKVDFSDQAQVWLHYWELIDDKIIQITASNEELFALTELGRVLVRNGEEWEDL